MNGFKTVTREDQQLTLSVEDEKIIRIIHDEDLEKALREKGNLFVARWAKEVYEEQWKTPIMISDDSLAVEIIGHVIPGDLSRKVKEKGLGELFDHLADKILSHTDIIDCGEKSVDSNRWVWDALEGLDFLTEDEDEKKN